MENVKVPACWKKEDCFEDVFLNRHGYYELRKKNTLEEREESFKENYFQENMSSSYAKEYSEEELSSIQNKLEERAWLIEKYLKRLGNWRGEKYSLLDLGCGEGFLLQYFHDRNVKVKGIDCGSFALEYWHPQMLPFYEQGSMENVLPQLKEQNEKFDVINADRVLDMVLNPEKCIEMIKDLMKENSIFIIKVANNYSNLQRMLLKSGELKKEYWLDDPGHPSYFNKEGLLNLLDSLGFECLDFYGDTFVDFHLLNPATNYYESPQMGKMAHKTSVRFENLLHEISMERTVEIYRMLGDMGFGREIVGIFCMKK